MALHQLTEACGDLEELRLEDWFSREEMSGGVRYSREMA
jgi:hypothetical protein